VADAGGARQPSVDFGNSTARLHGSSLNWQAFAYLRGHWRSPDPTRQHALTDWASFPASCDGSEHAVMVERRHRSSDSRSGGFVDLYIGPEAPMGTEKNWIPSDPGHNP